jgi:WD40 repeat protein
VLDHQFHKGSNSYILVLTENGFIHFYKLFEKTENWSKGKIAVTRGSSMFMQDNTGLYLSVVSPLVQIINSIQCRQIEEENNYPP